MGNTRDQVGKAGLFVAGGIFRTAFYVCVAVLIFWIGKSAYQFGYNVFNQQAVSPGAGQEVTVVIPEGSSTYDVAKILKSKGLIDGIGLQPTVGMRWPESNSDKEGSFKTCLETYAKLGLELQVTELSFKLTIKPEDIDEKRAKEALERAEEQLRQKQSMQEYYVSKASLATKS